jgi:hypothetical protein
MSPVACAGSVVVTLPDAAYAHAPAEPGVIAI